MKPSESRRWTQLRASAKRRWSLLTDADLDDVRGNIERLIDALSRRYEYARRKAEGEIISWRRSLLTE